MKKKGPGTMYDLDLSEIFDTKTTIEQKLPDFMLFREAKSRMIPKLSGKTRVPVTQTWSVPGRTYTWFPYYEMYVTSKKES